MNPSIKVGDTVVRVSGKLGRVVSIDADNYARLENEVSTFYVPNLKWSTINNLDSMIQTLKKKARKHNIELVMRRNNK